jgi:hypothetical protein
MKILYTDYPIIELGDKSGEIAPIREIIPISYDNDKYCNAIVGGIETKIKSGYIYTKKGRCLKVPAFNPTKYGDFKK